LYQNFGIPYYLIFDLDLKEVKVYKLSENKYALLNYKNEGFTFDGDYNIQPNFSSVFQ